MYNENINNKFNKKETAMILRELRKNRILTINYYKNGSLKTCKGKIHKLNVIQQTLFLEDEKQKVFSIELGGIKDIS
ncbi:YolD-like family protein [Bacillus sp. OV322]